MKAIIFVSFIISLIHSKSLSPSKQIWNNVANYISTGLMIKNEYHFIYQEKNYTKLDINGDKMKDLYSRQDELYKKHDKLLNYIFIIKSLDTNLESPSEVILNLAKYIKLDYELDTTNSILVLIIIKNKTIEIYSGNDRFLKTDMENMKSNIAKYLENFLYYDAINNLINDIDYYYRKRDNNIKIFDSSSGGPPSNGIYIAIGIICFVVIIIIISKICCRSNRGGYVRGINNNYNNYGYQDNFYDTHHHIGVDINFHHHHDDGLFHGGDVVGGDFGGHSVGFDGGYDGGGDFGGGDGGGDCGGGDCGGGD